MGRIREIWKYQIFFFLISIGIIQECISQLISKYNNSYFYHFHKIDLKERALNHHIQSLQRVAPSTKLKIQNSRNRDYNILHKEIRHYIYTKAAAMKLTLLRFKQSYFGRMISTLWFKSWIARDRLVTTSPRPPTYKRC